MKKKLIVSGCSFTDYNFESLHKEYDCSFPKWPEIVAEKLGVECVNRGACGAGNNYIYSTLLDEVIRTPKEEILCVIPAWSQVQREDFETYSKYTPYNKTSHKDKFYDNMIWQNKRVNREGNIFYWMIDQLRRYISFETMCKAYGVPYVQFQMLSAYDGYLHGLMKTDCEVSRNIGNPDFRPRYEYDTTLKDVEEDKKYLLRLISDYEKYIDTDNFIGWPITHRLGGFAVEQEVMMDEKLQTNWDLCISKYDFHPNKKGHELLAEYIYGQLVQRL
jgi:hypothetical protein|tara:strand:- start:19 stop:843 length:825 start_codon:yes stop_codon:yes gene_type:complete